MGKTVTKFRWFWTWQDDAEEKWLEKMSQKGYHLTSVGWPGFYTFSVAEPRNCIYRLDYQTFRKKDKQEYLQIFRDAGWEHIGEMLAWQYFCKEARLGETPEIFTDIESKIAKNKRVLTYISFFYIILLGLTINIILTGPARYDSYPWWGNIPSVIMVLVLIFLTYAIIRLVVRIRQLKKL